MIGGANNGDGLVKALRVGSMGLWGSQSDQTDQTDQTDQPDQSDQSDFSPKFCRPFVCPNTAERYNKVDSNGKNTGNNLVNIDALRVIRWIGLEPSVEEPGRKRKVTVYGFHSLRHSFASYCAEMGIPKAVVLSILGASSDIIDKYYTHVGEEAQRKAIDALNFGNAAVPIASPQSRIDKALAWIASLESKSEEIQAVEALLRGI